MTSNEEKPGDNHSKKDKPANGVNADWAMVIFGIVVAGLGIASVTNLITLASVAYQTLRWYMVAFGIICIIWGFASGKRR
jgi:hypothetical protein